MYRFRIKHMMVLISHIAACLSFAHAIVDNTVGVVEIPLGLMVVAVTTSLIILSYISAHPERKRRWLMYDMEGAFVGLSMMLLSCSLGITAGLLYLFHRGF